MTDSFILGLSSGSACLVTCGMVMFPYILAGPAGVRKIAFDLSAFMFTRLVIYFVLATLSWYFGKALLTAPVVRTYVPGVLYIVFAVMLIWYSIGRNRKKVCPAKIVTAVENRKLVPVLLGVVNSLGFCPALLLILTKGAFQGTLTRSYLAFLAFFAGSSLWFLPLPIAGKLKKKQVLETIGVLATGLAGMPFMKINPNYTGGEVAFREISPACTLVVHKPVFNGFLRERKEGFVQVDWRGKIPEIISDTIYYDGNGTKDFLVSIDTKSNAAKITPFSKYIV